MADNRFECIFRVDPIDVGDVVATRRALIDVINDDGFAGLLTDLRMAAEAARGGPTPRGGELSVGCSASSGGNVSCGGSLTIRF